MPCGGIEPMKNDRLGSINDKLDATQGGCWICDRGGAQHMCFEWDTYIHARCVPQFLNTDEGRIVIDHGHLVVLDFSLEETTNEGPGNFNVEKST